MAAEEWDRKHPIEKNGVPARLFTDENPATTIKGTGFRDHKMAERTILLTSQKGVRYKQFWTIKAMRERAAHHPHQSSGMRDAIAVFDKWLEEAGKRPPLSAQEKKERLAEWREYQKLCRSAANAHSYSASPSQNDLNRARDDLKKGRHCLLQCLAVSQNKARSELVVSFPLTAFTGLFGGPGLHGYGKHELNEEESVISINGIDGLRELLPQTKSFPIGAAPPQTIKVICNRHKGKARVELEYASNRATLSILWEKTQENCAAKSAGETDVAADATQGQKESIECVPSWICDACTFEHAGESKQIYLACEICASPRSQSKSEPAIIPDQKANESSTTATKQLKVTAVGGKKCSWGSLKPPTNRDIQGPRKRHKGLDAPPPLLDYIVVMDFEWTADNKARVEPIAEITQFPAVVMKLEDRKWGTKNAESVSHRPSEKSHIPLPTDLSTPTFSNRAVNADAFAISAFDTFVRPTLNPKLTKFSIELTGISQADVNKAPTIGAVVKDFVQWLISLELVNAEGVRKGNWCFATWGDGDIMSTLRQEIEFKSLDLPPCFDRWINLKNDSIFKKHYGREPRGGLRKCVESVGCVWEGRAHNGLVDSFNTAKIVQHMVQTGFRFTRATRGLNRNGVPFGQAKR